LLERQQNLISSNSSLKQRRLLVFDFDGTLADTFGLFLDVFDKAAATHHFDPFDRRNLTYLRTLDARSILEYHRVPVWKLPFVARTMRKLMGQQIQRIQVFPGIEAAITQLHGSGATLAILTSNAQSNVLTVLGPHIAAHFSYLECSVSLLRKRARLAGLLVQARFGSAEAMLIGDELRDVHAAKQSDVPFAAVGWGYTAPETLIKAGAQEYFSSPEEMAVKLTSHIPSSL